MQQQGLKKNAFLISLILCFFFCFSFQAKAKVDENVILLRKVSEAFSEIAKKAIPAVVFIKTEKKVKIETSPFDFFSEDPFFKHFFGPFFPFPRQPKEYKQRGLGSGFIISHNGYILTNNHVISGADRITVRLHDGREFKAKIIGTDPNTDIALLKIDADDLPVLPLGDSDKLQVGEIVMAIGNPFGLSYTLTVGVVSAKGRSNVGITDYESFIQTDAAINPGNSGGPLINIKGEAVGVNTAIFTKSGGYMGIGFAIPINMVKSIEKQLIEKGEVTRGYLGVVIQNMTPELRESFGLKKNEGVLISDVIEGSPAQKAGLKRGDVVIEFNGKKVTDVSQFRNMVALTPPGTKVRIVVIRNGKRKELKVVLGNLKKATLALSSRTEILKKLGFSVQNLTRELAEQFGYTGEKGVLISQVAPGSPASRAGLEPGMLIMEVNRIPVKNIKEFFKALKKSKKTGKVLLLVYDGEYTRYVLLNLR